MSGVGNTPFNSVLRGWQGRSKGPCDLVSGATTSCLWARGIFTYGTNRTVVKPETKTHRVLSAQDISRALTRIAHEILERNGGAQEIALVGMHTRGVPLAKRLVQSIQEFEGFLVPLGSLDIVLYRDDLSRRIRPLIRPSDIDFQVENKRIILIDDVLFTGRTIRAAMDALNDFGRPSQIQLGVLVDRGHRELPIRPDYVGKNVPTSSNQEIDVLLEETDDRDEVVIVEKRKT